MNGSPPFPDYSSLATNASYSSAERSSSVPDTSFTLINHASYGALLIVSGASRSSSLISSTSPVTGEYTSDTAFTDSTSPNTSPASTLSPASGRFTNTRSPSADCA